MLITIVMNLQKTIDFIAVLEYYTNKPPKGEIVIVVGGKKQFYNSELDSESYPNK